MKLVYKERTGKTKGETNSLRREGYIPAIIYVRGKAGELIAVSNSELQAHMRKIQKGFLPTTIFTLTTDKGSEVKAIVKEIQYNRTTYDIIHLDFECLIDQHMINVKVPIEFTEVADCVGIKLGGVLRPVIRHLKVRCFPKDMPNKFSINVRQLAMNQSKRLSAIALPQGVVPLANMNEVAVVVAKK